MVRTIYGLLFLLVACDSRQPPADSRQPAESSGNPDAGSRLPAADQRTILFLGTSLTAGLGVDPDSAYPAVIQRRLDSAGIAIQVINGGVSGETSAGALRRIPFVLRGPLSIVVIETGANDGLRGLDADSTRANIEAIIAAIHARDSTTRIVLAGMEAPPNMGPRFTAGFRAIYPRLAREHRLPLVPFLLEGVGGIDTLNQPDGIHPTPRGHRLVADNVWRILLPLVR
jgi:acyl-CoA thioesterase-1